MLEYIENMVISVFLTDTETYNGETSFSEIRLLDTNLDIQHHESKIETSHISLRKYFPTGRTSKPFISELALRLHHFNR